LWWRCSASERTRGQRTKVSRWADACAERGRLEAWVRDHAPDNTCKTYKVYAKQYIEYASSRSLAPESQVTLCAFMRHALENRRLARSTITSVIPAAVEDMFKFSSMSPGRDAGGRALLKATKKTICMLTKSSVPKKPALRSQLEEMASMCGKGILEVRDMFLLILMFVGFLRESEAVGLCAEDVWLQKDAETDMDTLYVVVKKSKTDQFSENATIVIGACPQSPLCPVRWYLEHGGLRMNVEPLFHQLGKAAGQQLAKATPNHILKKWMKRIKVDPKGYGSHSLRRGGTTAAAKAKVRMHVIKRHGRWASDAVYLYIVDGLEEQVMVASAVLGF